MCVLRSFILCQQKKTARPRKLRHFVPSRWLHPLAPLKRLSLVDLPSANSIKCCSPPASLKKLNTEKLTVDLRPLRTKSAVFFYPHFQKRRSIPMTKPKTIDQLRAEKERAETQLLQEQHKLERLENRKKYLEKGERTKRTHRLCNLGGTVESLAPEVKDLTRTEMTELMEHIFSLSEVQRAVRHMAITHISQANREKELKADGTISSKRHAD